MAAYVITILSGDADGTEDPDLATVRVDTSDGYARVTGLTLHAASLGKRSRVDADRLLRAISESARAEGHDPFTDSFTVSCQVIQAGHDWRRPRTC